MPPGLQGMTEDESRPIFSDWSMKTISLVSAADSDSVCHKRNINKPQTQKRTFVIV